MLLKLADSHTHLNQINTSNILKEAPDVKLFINIGTLLEDDFTNLLVHDEIYCTYGIHPNDYLKIENYSFDYNIDNIQKILRNKIINTVKCVGIGETGLDFPGEANKRQYDLLHMQLTLAAELKKTVVIHARGCDLSNLIKIISSYKVKFVLHCYTYDLTNAMLAIEFGGYISFSGILTFGKKVKQLEEAAKYLPKERIVIETDAPYLAPDPYRGKENHPKYLHKIVEYLAQLRNEDVRETADYTFRNTCQLFNISTL
jgi:TatD DNase family protein